MLIAAAALTGFGAVTAEAATIYTDRASFLAAITGAVTEDFEENATGSFTNYGPAYAGTGFTVAAANLYTVDPDFFADYYEWNSGDVLDFEQGAGTITTNASALGFDYGNPADLLGTGTVTINGVDYILTGQPTFNFFGIVDTGPLGAVTINWQGGLGVLDNLTISGAVPEPATWSLMIVGFGLVGLAARRRKVAVSA